MHSEKRPFRKKRKVKKIFFFVAAILVITTVTGTVVMLLWNAIIPNVLNTRPIKLWEAIGLLVLCRLLTGGFGRKMRRKKRGWKKRWMNMTEEERMEFKARWKERCGRK